MSAEKNGKFVAGQSVVLLQTVKVPRGWKMPVNPGDWLVVPAGRAGVVMVPFHGDPQVRVNFGGEIGMISVLATQLRHAD